MVHKIFFTAGHSDKVIRGGAVKRNVNVLKYLKVFILLMFVFVIVLDLSTLSKDSTNL
jgi:hypothetical protein